MKKYLLALLLLALFALPSHAQSVLQSGSVTPGHVSCWTTNGVVQDCGTSAIPFATSIGVVGSGALICQNSGPVTGAYNSICLNVTGATASLNVTNNNGATGTPQVCTNGVCVSIGLSGNITIAVRSSNSATVTASASSDYFLCLDPTATAQTVNLPPSPATGLSFLIKDCTGQSGTHNITVTPAAGNIDGQTTFVLNVPFESAAVTYTGAQWSVN